MSGGKKPGGPPRAEISTRAGDPGDAPSEHDVDEPEHLPTVVTPGPAAAFAAAERDRTDEPRPGARRSSSGASLPAASDEGGDEGGDEAGGAEERARARLIKPRLPLQLGRYTLTERLGIGGMAEVFKAEQAGPAGFRKIVVVKRILPHLAENPRFVEMFFREARVASQLNHHNIVQINELGEDAGTYFIAMEFVDGLSLFHLAKRAWKLKRSLPMELVVTAVADAANGLWYAHHDAGEPGSPLGLVHRDISPDNLMVNRDGVTKVLDFGIAKGAESQNVTKTGEMKGKIPYMPPEQLHGVEVDHRADLYSLGITLFWLLTGRRPFHGDSDLLLMQSIITDPAPRPSSLNPAVPPILEEWVMALLEKDPANRPQTGEEVARALLDMISIQRRDLGAFMSEIRAANVEVEAGEITSGFLPSSPVTETLVRDTHRRPEISGSVRVAPGKRAKDKKTRAKADPAGPASTSSVDPKDRPPVDVSLSSSSASAAAAGFDEPAYVEDTVINRETPSAVEATAPAAVAPAAVPPATEDAETYLLPVEPSPAAAPPPAPSSISLPSVDDPSSLPATFDDDRAFDTPDTGAAPSGGRSLWMAAAAVSVIAVVAAGVYSAGAGPAARPPPPAVGAAARGGTSEASDPSPASTGGDVAAEPAAPGALGEVGSPSTATPGDEPPTGVAPVDPSPGAATPEAPGAHGDEPGLAHDEEASAPASPRPRSRAARPAPRTRRVDVDGPAHIKWQLPNGKTLGSGKTALQVPPSARTLVAFDSRRGVKTTVPVSGHLRYRDLQRGTLHVRAYPYAIVYAGSEKLGTTPFAPVSLVEGTYKLKLVHENEVQWQTVTVRPGETVRVKATFGG